MSQAASSRQRVMARSFQRLYPPPAFVTITWYLPFDSNCTSGVAVSGVLKTRIGAATPPDGICKSDSSVACNWNRVVRRARSWSSRVVDWNNGSDSNRFCIGRPCNRYARERKLIPW